MFGIIGAEAVQLVNQFAGKTLRGGEFWSTVNNTMADANDAVEAKIFFEPANNEIAAGTMIGGFDRNFLRLAIFVLGAERGIGKADALEFAGDEALHWCIGAIRNGSRGRSPHRGGIDAVKGEFDAGGATVDGEDAIR